MAKSLKDRKNEQVNPTEQTILNITGKAPAAKKEKYAVNVVFDGKMEAAIRERADRYGVGVATFIKMLVSNELNKD